MKRRAHKTSAPLPPEEQLLEYVQHLQRHRRGRRALHLRLSALSRAFRQEHHLRTAERPFRALLESGQGQFFRLANGDFLCIVKAPRAALESPVLEVMYMLRDDPRLKAAIDAGEEDAFLCHWFDLETDYDALLRLARDLAAGGREPETGVPVQETPPAAASRPSPPRQGPPRGYVSLVREAREEPPCRALDAEALARLERTLAGADLGRFLIRRPVCLVSGEGTRQTVMRDIGIDRDALARAVVPGYDLGAEPWFAARLGEHFARHLLALAPPVEAGSLLAVLLRTSIGAIASAEFTQFVNGLDRARRRSLVLAVPAAEALLRPLRYLRARERIAGLGLRSALTGFDPLALVLHDPQLLPADFLILDGRRLTAWDGSDVDSYPVLCGRIRNMDAARLVLEGCDDEDLLARGRRLGIRLFEGALFGHS
ncbi:MAG: hypothetical protein ACE5ED_05030 [Rhodothalassiaceae bacterium]